MRAKEELILCQMGIQPENPEWEAFRQMVLTLYEAQPHNFDSSEYIAGVHDAIISMAKEDAPQIAEASLQRGIRKPAMGRACSDSKKPLNST